MNKTNLSCIGSVHHSINALDNKEPNILSDKTEHDSNFISWLGLSGPSLGAIALSFMPFQCVAQESIKTAPVAVSNNTNVSEETPSLNEWQQFVVSYLTQLQDVPEENMGPTIIRMVGEARDMPPSIGRNVLIGALANACTEGDRAETVQFVADTISGILRNEPELLLPEPVRSLEFKLAYLVHYNDAKTDIDSPKFREEISRLKESDQKLYSLKFKLLDLNGKLWELSALKGQFVIVNFWNTWCGPCVKELPDLQELSTRYDGKLVVLGIVDEDPNEIKSFVDDRGISFPTLMDTDSKVREDLKLEGVPLTMIFNKEGNLVSYTYDRRTIGQFEKMLDEAGLSKDTQ